MRGLSTVDGLCVGTLHNDWKVDTNANMLTVAAKAHMSSELTAADVPMNGK